MKLHEYQAKAILSQYGVPVPRGGVASTAREAGKVTRDLGGRAVLKAQVHAGGRGKAGGIRVAGSPEEAEEYAASLLGTRLVTAQTGPEGVPVGKLLVEEPAQVAQELYVALTVDRGVQGPVMIASDAGGMEIEQVAAREPGRIHREGISPLVGFQPFQGRRLCRALRLDSSLVRPAAQLMGDLYRAFVENDCSLLEINPLAVAPDGRIIALDAKLNLDDDSLVRHPELRELRDPGQEDPFEARAHEFGISYVKLPGDVGCLVNGAGLAMATMDVISTTGASPANFLDVGGGAGEEKVAQAFGIILSDPQVKRVLVNVFGGILRCDIAAGGIVKACRDKGKSPPILVRMLGTNVEEGKAILRESGLNVTFADSLADVAKQLVPSESRG
jgi:succinyl-CoA synthetase beta subunit